jgi:hypothetical protein
MFMNSMEDGGRNPGSRPWTFKTRENPDLRLLMTVNTNSVRYPTAVAHATPVSCLIYLIFITLKLTKRYRDFTLEWAKSGMVG